MCLPSSSPIDFRIAPCRGFPFRASRAACRMRNLTGLPGFSKHISSYMPRPLDSDGPFHPSQIADGLVLSSVNVKTLDVRVIFSRSCHQHFRVHGKPLWPARFPVYASPVLFARLSSATGATLGTGGWLTLTRRGLPPRKMCRTCPGAIRGRNAGYPAPPAQSRTCRFPASGSSVVLASVCDKPLTRTSGASLQ
jgi:hypothetical protein